jgi:hypothetical protein
MTARSSSFVSSSAALSCSRHRFLNAWSVDQEVSSNACRAEATARAASSGLASETLPMISSVAGFSFSKVRSVSTSSPSISIRGSPRTVITSSAMVFAPQANGIT